LLQNPQRPIFKISSTLHIQHNSFLTKFLISVVLGPRINYTDLLTLAVDPVDLFLKNNNNKTVQIGDSLHILVIKKNLNPLSSICNQVHKHSNSLFENF
jgi:hypothetical protein